MNKEFLKMQKIAGLITENQVKEIIGDIDDTPSPGGDKNLDQETYMDILNTLFDALGNGANAYDDNTWGADESLLAGSIANILTKAGVDIS